MHAMHTGLSLPALFVISSNKTFPSTGQDMHMYTEKKKERTAISDCSGSFELCPPDVTGDGKVLSHPAEPSHPSVGEGD